MNFNYSGVSRRTFVKGVAASALLLSTSVPIQARSHISSRQSKQDLEDNIFHLNIEKTTVNITGEPAVATTVNGMLCGPTLRIYLYFAPKTYCVA